MAYSQAHRLPLPSEPSTSKLQSENRTISFDINLSKLNPGFEAYKLVQDDPSAPSFSARSYGLPSRPPRLIDLYQAGGEKKEGNLTFAGLGYRETKERALHQVLLPASGSRGHNEPFAAYIDANRFVVVLTYGGARDKVVGHPVHRIAGEGQGLPSLASITSTEWVASDGASVVRLKLRKVNVGENGAVRWISDNETKWRIPGNNDAGKRATIKACKRIDRKIRLLLQSTKVALSSGSDKAGMQGLGFQQSAQQQANGSRLGQPAQSQTVFELQLVELNDDGSDGANDAQDSRIAQLLWRVEGEEPLITATLREQETLLGAEASFHPIEDKDTKASRLAAESQHTKSCSRDTPATSAAAASRSRRRAPHFSWAQTSDTVTVALALPSWITKSHIRAHFSLSALSLSFTQDALDLVNAPSTSSAKIAEIDKNAIAQQDEEDDLTHAARMIASERYVSRPTWAEIDPTGSVWTVERARGMSLLTLHLEKRHEGTRWMQVFADRSRTTSSQRNRGMEGSNGVKSSQTQLTFQQAKADFQRMATEQHIEQHHSEEDDAEDNEDDIPETMDPSELLNMLEGMQKYTVDEDSVDTGMDRTGFTSTSGHGQNGGTSLSLDQPSLLKDNLEEEDANVGRNFVVSSISHTSSSTSHVRTSKDGEVTLLATSLPSSTDEDLVVVKNDLDGLIFARSATTSEVWNHVATMPALAFVLASKRDAQRVYVHRNLAKVGQEGEFVVLAFESAPQVTGSNSGSGAGNLFLYYSPASTGAKNARSRVVRLGAINAREEEEKKDEGASGALLGVCAVKSAQEEGDVLVCLCENRVLLLRGLL